MRLAFQRETHQTETSCTDLQHIAIGAAELFFEVLRERCMSANNCRDPVRAMTNYEADGTASADSGDGNGTTEAWNALTLQVSTSAPSTQLRHSSSAE